MNDELAGNEPTRRQWVGFWSMIVQQTQNAFNDKMAQFTLIPLGGAVAFAFLIPAGDHKVAVDVPSIAGLMMALPFMLFAPLAGWVSDRFSKRDVMLASAIFQALVLGWICFCLSIKSMPLALCGFFALAVQSAFYSPAKFGINKELVGSKYLGFASGIQQMTTMLAILAGQILSGWLFDHRLKGMGGGPVIAWHAALTPLVILAILAVPALALTLAIPRVPAQGHVKFTRKLAVSHFTSLAELWRDAPLRRASFGVAFFWGFAAFINLWSVKLAQMITGGGEGFGTLSSIFMAAASLGMAGGFGCASFLLRKRVELAWVPLAGLAMTVCAISIAFMVPEGWPFLTALALLAFFAAIFLAPLNAWMQDRYPADKRGEFQSATNLQDCIGGLIAVIIITLFEHGAKALGVPAATAFRYEIAFVGLTCGLVSLSVIRLLPADFVRFIGVRIIRSIYRIKATGMANIPATGGALLLPNHVTFADAFYITAASPRPVRFVMDEAFMASRLVRIFVSLFDTVTIRRDQPREAIRITIDALKNGDLVCLFPEGQLTRTGSLSELRRGFELIARKAEHPLIPMWCDGSWGSIFSFERGRFFRKWPYHLPYGLNIAFGPEIPSTKANLETVREAMLECSAIAVARRFDAPGWGMRIPSGNDPMVACFRSAGEAARRRWWVNGHQIGQMDALKRKQPFRVLDVDDFPTEVPGLTLAFPEFFGTKVELVSRFTPGESPTWVGGDDLREAIEQTSSTASIRFLDFGTRALEPLDKQGVTHLPCLAVDGIVVSMSMENPPMPVATSEPQSGNKPGTWGKLLPGFYLLTDSTGRLRAHGPSAPEEGLLLPEGAKLDPEGFLANK